MTRPGFTHVLSYNPERSPLNPKRGHKKAGPVIDRSCFLKSEA
jgi:hypothetical protein